MKRFLWLLLLPIVWAPLIGLLAVVQLPWWGYLFGGLFWWGIARRRAARHAADNAPSTAVDGAAQFASIPGGRFW